MPAPILQGSRALPETLVKSSVLRTVDGRTLEWDVDRWMAPADHVDESLLDRAIGPVLDVGCGPGRHVSSLLSRGVEALGIDTSPTAVRLARRRGAPVAHQSIFDAVPDTGQWRCGLLLDGSIGIGGNPESLLRRVSGVLSKRGRLLVETVHPQQASEDLHVRVETAVSSGPWFRWSVVSHLDVAALAATSGFLVNDTWEDEGRYFAQLERIADP